MFVRRKSPPSSEPITLDEAKLFCRVTSDAENSLFEDLWIPAAREAAEIDTERALAQGTFIQVLDSFPYYTDTIQSQLAYPPSYYSLPRYSTTLWNYSQMIKIMRSPLISIDIFNYVDTSGTLRSLHEGDD